MRRICLSWRLREDNSGEERARKGLGGEGDKTPNQQQTHHRTITMHHNYEQQLPLYELRIVDSYLPTDHHHSNAAHVPYAASTVDSGNENSLNEGYDEDNEPTGSGGYDDVEGVGPV